MHVLRPQAGAIDDGGEPVDLAQSPAEIVVLTAADTEIAGLARARAELGAAAPSLRLASLLQLGHTFSVDLYLENTLAHAKLVVVRLIGGAGYWRYGTDELVRLGRGSGMKLVVLTGEQTFDDELSALSTVPGEVCRRLYGYLVEGGPENYRHALLYAAHLLGRGDAPPAAAPLPKAGVYTSGDGAGRAWFETPLAAAPHHEDGGAAHNIPHAEERSQSASRSTPARPVAALVFYRALLQASDLAPVDALCEALRAEGLEPLPLYASSLKDPEAAAFVSQALAEAAPDVVLNTTAFALSGATFAGTPLDRTGAPVLQVAFAGASEAAWEESARGLAPRDLAMQVALPEVDGRVFTRAVSFKGESRFDEAVQASIVAHRPRADRVAYVARLAAAWARLRRTPPSERRIALVLSNDSGSDARIASALGLDAPASTVEILRALRAAGYALDGVPESGDALVSRLLEGPTSEGAQGRRVREWLSREIYEKALDSLPGDLGANLRTFWHSPVDDSFYSESADAFAVPALVLGNVAILVQPSRGTADPKAAHHDATLPPPHSYAAAYLWLSQVFRADAVVHVGAHGSLEWLPGKALALSASCWPEALLGATPLVYPFIVSNPGEGAQAKRRTSAVLVSHLVPPQRRAELHGRLRDLEALADEYAAASGLDPRRLDHLARRIFEEVERLGLDRELGLGLHLSEAERLARLDAFLCDVKDLPIRDGLHVFGRAPDPEAVERWREVLPPAFADAQGALAASGPNEMAALLAALDGRFVEPGPSGAPSRGRFDVLPTGRNSYAVDTRALPTGTAWELGRLAAEEVVTAYTQEHGRYPERIALSAWGSSAMRTGGDDIAQALAFMGARPVWDPVSKRVTGFEIVPLAELKRPRVDVVLRVSGFFRDAFPTQVDLIASAARALAEREEPANPIRAHALEVAASLAVDGVEPAEAFRAASRRVFSSAPGTYGAGVTDAIESGRWESRADLGAAYVNASAYAFGAGDEGAADAPGLEALLADTQAVLHAQDAREFDLLDSSEFVAFEGGLSAAVEAAGGAAPTIYHADTTSPGRPRVRRLAEEIALAVRGRAVNPLWIAGCRRHGYRGASELAQTVQSLFGFAATTDAVPPSLFEAVHAAYLEDEETRRFLEEKNPAALRDIAARFAEAIDRGLWQPRRNSVRAGLDELSGGACFETPASRAPQDEGGGADQRAASPTLLMVRSAEGASRTTHSPGERAA